MQVILLERIEKLGQMGDEVTVKPGFARNYLLPQRKALRATDANRALFEAQRAQLEAENLTRRSEAEAVKAKMDGQSIVIIRSAGESGQLYGSVSARDVADGLGEAGFTTDRRQVALDAPIKAIGLFDVRVVLHPEVDANITVNVAQSADEAAAQAERAARGEEAVLTPAEAFAREAAEEAAAQAAAEAEAMAAEEAEAAGEEAAPEGEAEAAAESEEEKPAS